MRSAVLPLAAVAATGCTTYHHLTVGPTSTVSKPTTPPEPGDPRPSDSNLGLDVAGELTSGNDNLRLLLAGGARAGHGITGGSIRAGVELGSDPRPTGVRASISLGPAFGAQGTTLDVHLGLGFDYGFRTDDSERGDKRTTLGAQLFLSSIGTGDDHRVMIGLGLSFGAFHYETLSIAAAPPRD